ncbi:MAG: IS3 family transposase [Nitrospirae bacterium]|nr:MAG: IS3 family transposase [Nitrospirota bacterium]
MGLICAVYRLARSSVYVHQRPCQPAPLEKRGPKTRCSDADVVGEIRRVLASCPFYGEGSRKVRARIARRGLAVVGKRVLHQMRTHGLLAPRRMGPPNGNPSHDGTIIMDRSYVMWGTDATRFSTKREGWYWFFGAIDHYTDEVVGWHVAKLGDRWAALEPVRQGVRHAYGMFAQDVARGLWLRCDWGPQYVATAWINEVQWLRITSSLSYVGEPECNGVAERFMRTLKEQCLYLHQFQSLAEVREIIAVFIQRYNTEWLIERLGHRTPAQARAVAGTPRAA